MIGGCGKKDDGGAAKGSAAAPAPAAGAPAAGSTAGTAAPTAAAAAPAPAPATGATPSALTRLGSTAVGAAAAPPPAGSSAATTSCQAACEHRASCGLGDAAGCTPECAALFDLGALDAATLDGYAAAPCDQVKQAEPQFKLGAACRRACAHRAECVTGVDLKACLPDCAALVVASGQEPDAALAAYVAEDCAAVTNDEPILTCLHACTHVLGCGVAGDLPGCLSYCTDQLEQGTTVDQVAEIGKADCAAVKQTVTLPGKAGAAGQHGCDAEGVYEVCDGSYCRDRVAASDGVGATEDAARQDALAACGHHLTKMVLVSQAAYRASVKQTCRVTRCR
ncbi:MAG: hypothetical protein H6709_06885 [Kofleriaceae bacterium]|nr:hypothetical protein [Kofleriaceae bacterium]